jgi:hypothetical protein
MTLIISTAFALVGYVLYPAAPPRLAGVGISDTVSKHTGLNLSSDLLGSFYNPFAAVPSLHFGYALIVGVTVAWLAAAGGCACSARCTPRSCSSTSSPRATTSGSTRLRAARSSSPAGGSRTRFSAEHGTQRPRSARRACPPAQPATV